MVALGQQLCAQHNAGVRVLDRLSKCGHSMSPRHAVTVYAVYRYTWEALTQRLFGLFGSYATGYQPVSVTVWAAFGQWVFLAAMMALHPWWLFMQCLS